MSWLMGKNFFDQPVKNDFITYENTWKTATGQGDNYATCCLLDYTYFEYYYKMIATDLSKPQALDANPKAIQQINFTENLDRGGQTAMFFIIEAKIIEAKIFRKELWEYFNFILF